MYTTDVKGFFDKQANHFPLSIPCRSSLLFYQSRLNEYSHREQKRKNTLTFFCRLLYEIINNQKKITEHKINMTNNNTKPY